MKMKSNIVYVFTFILCLFCCCNDDREIIKIDSESSFIWDEEFWQKLQTDSDFIKIQECINGLNNAFHKIEDNSNKIDEENNSIRTYTASNDTISKVITTSLLTLHEKYSQFSYQYYYKLLQSASSITPTTTSRADEPIIIGSCDNMRKYYAIISGQIYSLTSIYLALYCSECRASHGILEEVILNSITKYIRLSYEERTALLEEFHYFVNVVRNQIPSCEKAGELATKLYTHGSSIKDVADRIKILDQYLLYPNCFFDFPQCSEKGFTPGGGGSGGNPSNPELPDPEEPDAFTANLRIINTSSSVEIGEVYSFALNVYNKKASGPSPDITSVDYMVRREGQGDFVSMQEKTPSTGNILHYDRHAISFGKLEFRATVYIDAGTNSIVSNIVKMEEICPPISKFKDLPIIQSRAIELWSKTVRYTAKNSATYKTREYGCFIYLDTGTGIYHCGEEDIEGVEITLNKETKGTVVFIYSNQQYDPRNSFDLIVGTLHSHYPLTWAAPRMTRSVGPSVDDMNCDLPGIVYDYTDPIEAGDDVDMPTNPKILYTYGSYRRLKP